MFVRAEKGKGRRVIYHRNDGAKLIRTGGTPAWRNTNPGNIRSSTFAKENGSIGDANGFAVFPDYETGRRALARLLRGDCIEISASSMQSPLMLLLRIKTMWRTIASFSSNSPSLP